MNPELNFFQMPIELEVDWLHGFLFQGPAEWKHWIVDRYPLIIKVFDLPSEDDQIKFLTKFALEIRSSNQEKIDEQTKLYQVIWKEHGPQFLDELSQFIEMPWPKGRPIISALISINPICPRFLDSWSFALFAFYKNQGDALETMMHEIVHLLYFEKWQTLFPKTTPKDREAPSLAWHLSELIAPIMLNEPRMQKLLKQRAAFYPEYMESKISDVSVADYFTKMFREAIAREDTMDRVLISMAKLASEKLKPIVENNSMSLAQVHEHRSHF